MYGENNRNYGNIFNLVNRINKTELDKHIKYYQRTGDFANGENHRQSNTLYTY